MYCVPSRICNSIIINQVTFIFFHQGIFIQSIKRKENNTSLHPKGVQTYFTSAIGQTTLILPSTHEPSTSSSYILLLATYIQGFTGALAAMAEEEILQTNTFSVYNLSHTPTKPALTTCAEGLLAGHRCRCRESLEHYPAAYFFLCSGLCALPSVLGYYIFMELLGDLSPAEKNVHLNSSCGFFPAYNSLPAHF